MKIGMITDSLPGTDFDTLLVTAGRLELDMLEFGCGNWSSAPHLDLDRMLESETERRNFKARLAEHGARPSEVISTRVWLNTASRSARSTARAIRCTRGSTGVSTMR